MKQTKKHFLLCVVLLLTCSANAQFLGIRASNFGGITNVNYNPAIADNRFKLDFNLIGFDATVSNNYVGLSRKTSFNYNRLSEDSIKYKYLAERTNGNSKSLTLTSKAQLPFSFLVSFGKNHKNNNAIAFSTHANLAVNIDNANEAFVRNLFWGAGSEALTQVGEFRNIPNTAKNFGVKGMAWYDAGITYSRVVMDKDKHFLKAGITAKVVKGIGAIYAYSNDFTHEYPHLDSLNIDAKIYAGTTSNFYYPANDKVDFNTKDLINKNISNFAPAVDFGLVYEWRPNKDKLAKYEMDCKENYRNDKDKHKLAIGLSVVDLGRIKFNKDTLQARNYELHIKNYNVGQDFDQNTTLTEWDSLGTPIADKNSFKMWLPTMVNVYVDYNIGKGFGVNAAASISAIPSKNNNVHGNTTFAITPRYDHKFIGAYMPVSADLLGNISWGLGLRLGPLYIGSSDVFGYMIKKNKFNGNVQASLKVSIPNRLPKDKDKDGVSNKKDLCKSQKGNCLSQGCPDRDNDGILDAEDKCPDVAGLKELQGCPDADGDGIIDMEDDCPSVAGLKELKGCPDADGDGIADKDDDCPNEKGTKELQGCPDRDNDGVADKNDACPDLAGDKNHKGCPDTDKDGLYDNEDKCPTVAGPIENIGCPYKDTDNDGVLDKDDACPTVKGIKENKGCPEVDKKTKELIKKAFDNLEFETGKDIIRKTSYVSLNNLADILKQHTEYALQIDGHTDNVGKAELNQFLSEKRAAAVKKYLVNKGVNENRLTSNGYGLTKPVADNKTAAGRQKNRRVEMTVSFFEEK